ncbi:MAG: hypothetical protein ABIB61_02330 [Candidatus Shapirobacteria bacterium]
MAPWHLFGHFILGLLVGFLIYRKTKEKIHIVIAVLASFLIDLDHLFDFWVAYGFNLDYLKFFKIDFFSVNQAAYVPLHAWEWVAILFYFASGKTPELAPWMKAIILAKPGTKRYLALRAKEETAQLAAQRLHLAKKIKKYRWILLTIALAVMGHIFWDAISYGIYPLDYSILVRSLNGFEIRSRRCELF